MDRLAQLLVVKDALNTEDPEGLLALGCPVDEYDMEASLIAGLMTAMSTKQSDPLSVDQIASAVAEVWSTQFGPFDPSDLKRRRPAFLAVAQKISAHA